MDLTAQDFQAATLGECRVPSRMSGVKFAGDGDHVLYHSNLGEIKAYLDRGEIPPAFEMAGRTKMVVGNWKNQQTHVPIPLATSARKKIDPEGWVWNGVLASREMK